jgi:hypothetical protein
MENFHNISQFVLSAGAEQISQPELPLQTKLILVGILCIAIAGLVGITAIVIHQDIKQSK